jgi:hypothetical protein
MNLYNGPQRLLGNGDLAGAQQLYGQADIYLKYGYSAPYKALKLLPESY